MELKLKNKEVFDLNQDWRKLKIKIKANFESKEYNGTWIIKEIEEDFIVLLNLITRKESHMTVYEFNLLTEKYVNGDKVNQIEYEYLY